MGAPVGDLRQATRLPRLDHAVLGHEHRMRSRSLQRCPLCLAFLGSAFASSAFSNAAAVITDLFAPPDRARPMIVASLAPLLGPCFGPLFGALVSSELRWPFVFWLLGAIGLLFTAALFCVPETVPTGDCRSLDTEGPRTFIGDMATEIPRFRSDQSG